MRHLQIDQIVHYKNDGQISSLYVTALNTLHVLFQADPGPLHLWSKCKGSIDPSRSFLIVQLRWVKMHSTH
jgi:hypothetical protein